MRERLRLAVRGAVQGVGFRPFVYRLAEELRLDGWVRNSTLGVFIEVEGPRPALERFRARLPAEIPPRAAIHSLEASWLDPTGHAGFEILESTRDGAIAALVMPDIAMCADCLADIMDPANRRYRYPFTNCTNCGPRFSIIESLPYDRVNTSMRRFVMCDQCLREYHDPYDRRFHAQPNACPICGPRLHVWDGSGEAIAVAEDALQIAARAIRRGDIVAVKGLGGFHLMADAANDAAVARLRERKHREEKPFAVMCPDLADVRRHCDVSDAESRLLTSPEAPIVLLARRDAGDGLSRLVAPGNPNVGVMLPYTPLHALLLREVGGAVIATSGNRSDEPICTDEHEALERLGSLADLFLVHDRPIVRHVDDSIVRIVLDRELVMRRARGYAPLPVPIGHESPPLLAVGAHLKNTIALATGRHVVVSQHIGDLESPEASAAFVTVMADLQQLYEISPVAVVADLHPDYRSTRYAVATGLPVSHIQHHVAHVAACMAENDLDAPALGVAWDGTGYGLDGTVWGGEFFAVDRGGFTRLACLRPFRLPGGERAIKEPRRSALGVLQAMADEDGALVLAPSVAGAFNAGERALLIDALSRELNAPVTTSAGRLFDAIASLVDLRQRSSFEGQAAMELEFAAARNIDDAYPFALSDAGGGVEMGSWEAPPLVIDWAPMVRAVVDDVAAEVDTGIIAARAHNTMAAMIVAVAQSADRHAVVLSGGCFQNRYLTERTVTSLRQAGFRPYWHQRIPPNDGGIALGQIAAYLRIREISRCVSPYQDESSRSTAPIPCCAAAGSTSPAS